MNREPVKLPWDTDQFRIFTESLCCATDIDSLSRNTIVLLEKCVQAEEVSVVISDVIDQQKPFFIISDNPHSESSDNVIQKLMAELANEAKSDRRVSIGSALSSERHYLTVTTTTHKRFTVIFQYLSSGNEIDKETVNFLETLGNILVVALETFSSESMELGNLQEIIAAKQEWEASIDHMPQLICYLNGHGEIVRANKTIEDWYNGDVKNVKGRQVHELLHPNCEGTDCELLECWNSLWPKVENSGHGSMDIYDHIIDRSLSVTIRRSGSVDQNLSEDSQGAVLIIQDISDSLWDKYLLESYSQELMSQIEDKSKQLEQVNEHLITEKNSHSQAKESLIRTESKLQSLSSQLLNAHEEERKRIAGELHDSIGQSLSVIKLKLQGISAKAAQSESGVNGFDSLFTVVNMTIDEVRRISMGLRPSILDDIGLSATLQWLTREFEESFESIQLDTDFDIDDSVLSDTQKVVLFRIIQEALNNITKHAEASSIFVSVSANEEVINLYLEDNGKGFDHSTSVNKTGFGLSSMRERAKLSGGELVINSELGKGTTIKGLWEVVD